jgi:hypothetical protein
MQPLLNGLLLISPKIVHYKKQIHNKLLALKVDRKSDFKSLTDKVCTHQGLWQFPSDSVGEIIVLP